MEHTCYEAFKAIFIRPDPQHERELSDIHEIRSELGELYQLGEDFPPPLHVFSDIAEDHEPHLNEGLINLGVGKHRVVGPLTFRHVYLLQDCAEGNKKCLEACLSHLSQELVMPELINHVHHR